MFYPKTVYFYRSGSARERRVPHLSKTLPWHYYIIIGASLIPEGTNLPTLDYPWVYEDACRTPNDVEAMIEKKEAAAALDETGWWVGELMLAYAAERQPLEKYNNRLGAVAAGPPLSPAARKLAGNLSTLLKK
jgi:hypothetical protein